MEAEDFKTLVTSAELTDEQKAVLTDEKVLGAILPAFKTKLAGAYSETTNKTLTAVDQKIKAETGVDKLPGEQSSDYYIRASKEIAKRESANLQSEIEKLKAEKKGATPEELSILKTTIANLEKEKADLANGYKSELSKIAFDTRFDRIKGGITFNPVYEADVLEPALERIKAKAMSAKTVEIDGVTYVSENGLTPVYVDSKPQSLDDFIKKELSRFEAKAAQKGTGANDDAGKRDSVANPHGLKSTTKTEAFSELENTLKAKGLNQSQIWPEMAKLTSSDFYKSLK